MFHSVWTVAGVAFALNLPFGFWRAGAPRFSRPWLLAVHLPVPIVVALRLASGLGFKLATFPAIIGACVGGQLLGGALRRSLKIRLRMSGPRPATRRARQ